jgi:hypothetical protein
VAAAGGQAAGDAVGGLGLVARLQVVVRSVDGLDRDDVRERVRVRVDALLAEAVGLCAPFLDELLGGLLGRGLGVAHSARIMP